jgi:hypothetical protein
MTIPNSKNALTQAVSLLTYDNYQFAVWYDVAGELHIGRIRRGVHRWGVNHQEYTFAGAPRTVLNLPVADDDHNYPAIAVDGLGRLHVWANMHIEALKYVRTSAAHTTDGWLATAGWVDATGELPSVGAIFTYPTPVPLRDGTIWFYARNDVTGSRSGMSDSQYWTLAPGSTTWSPRRTIFQGCSVPNAGGAGIAGSPAGVEDVTNYNAYPTNFLVEDETRPHPGRIHMSWIWRHTGVGGGVSGEENVLPCYAYSDNGGHEWKTIDGVRLPMPITPLNSIEARVPGGALVTQIARAGSIVVATLDTPNHGLAVGDTITCVVQDVSYNADVTVAVVGPGSGLNANQVAWGQAVGDDPSGGVGSVTKIRYKNWGGITVDEKGLPHIVCSISPRRYIRRNAANTAWVESTITNPVHPTLQVTSRAVCFWLRGHLWQLSECTPGSARRVRLLRVTGSTSPQRVVTMSGIVGTGAWDPSHDPEAYRRFGTVEILAPNGDKPAVFTFGGQGYKRLAA